MNASPPAIDSVRRPHPRKRAVVDRSNASIEVPKLIDMWQHDARPCWPRHRYVLAASPLRVGDEFFHELGTVIRCEPEAMLDPELEDGGDGGRNLDARTLFSYHATPNTLAMLMKEAGRGSQYAIATVDENGSYFAGRSN